jgi:gas vesicle protein
MSKKGKFALGALFGAAAGVITGFLTAPKSGKETRADIKRKAGEVKDGATAKVGEVKSKAGAATANVRSEADKLKKRTANAVSGAREGFNKEIE